ncbi:MAG: treY, partial [Polaromonas sp.]|nr:treY [Polaromonas sp.]
PDGSHCMAPGAADQIMLYQTLFGAWPPGFDPSDAQARRLLSSRVAAWQEKALREAKLASSWMAPQQDYEAACRVFLDALLDGADAGSFAREMGELVAGLTPAAHSNAMTQTLLRLTSPGIPDLYQGSELDDFSLVDPDNRRPVDMARRRAALATPAAGGPLQEKQSLIADVLRLRRQHPLLFAGGEYLPLKVVGGHRDHVIAFARRHEGVVAITVALRHAATLHGGPDAGAAALTDTRALLPEGFPVTWRHALTDKGHAHAAAACLPLAEVMGGAPVALLVSEPV